MGIVFHTKIGKSYKKPKPCQKPSSHQLPPGKVTPQNLQFLTSLGLQVEGGQPRRKKNTKGKGKRTLKSSK